MALDHRLLIGYATLVALLAVVGTLFLGPEASREAGAQVSAEADVDQCVTRIRSYTQPCAPETLDTPAERELFRKKHRQYVDRMTKRNPNFSRDSAIAKFEKVMANVDRNGVYTDPRAGRLEDARANWGRQEEPSQDTRDAGREFLERQREERAARVQEEPPLE